MRAEPVSVSRPCAISKRAKERLSRITLRQFGARSKLLAFGFSFEKMEKPPESRLTIAANRLSDFSSAGAGQARLCGRLAMEGVSSAAGTAAAEQARTVNQSRYQAQFPLFRSKRLDREPAMGYDTHASGHGVGAHRRPQNSLLRGRNKPLGVQPPSGFAFKPQ